jgi:hypothetical protein
MSPNCRLTCSSISANGLLTRPPFLRGALEVSEPQATAAVDGVVWARGGMETTLPLEVFAAACLTASLFSATALAGAASVTWRALMRATSPSAR